MDPPRPHLLCLSYHVPYDGVPHAGGAFVLRHLRALATSFDVTTVVPATEFALPVAASAPADLHVEVLGQPRRHGAVANTVERVRKVLAGVSPGAVAARRLVRHPRFAALVRAADVVELQWSELLTAVPSVRRLRPDVPIVCVCHDVVAQALHRKGDVAPPHRRVFYRVAAWRARTVERRLLDRCTSALVFSEKDRQLLVSLGVGCPIDVIDPDLTPPRRPAARPTAPTVLFVGAMDRRENFEAVLGFLDDMWPRVKQQVPDARLHVVGADPPDFLVARADDDVLVTGHVDDLDPWYRDATVFVVPLRLGAGLKFKVPQAMLYGLPVVATSVGAEGIVDVAGDSVFAAVSDEPAAFADAVVRVLRDPAYADAVGARARAWALARYDFTRSTERVVADFHRLIAAARDDGPTAR